VIDDPTLPGGLATFTVTSGPGTVTVDSVNSGTGLQTFTVVSQVNAVVTIPPFTPGTFNPVTATYTIINPALPVDITLRAASQFHGVIIRLRCGTPPSRPKAGNKVSAYRLDFSGELPSTPREFNLEALSPWFSLRLS
jgi:hypothetical protein